MSGAVVELVELASSQTLHVFVSKTKSIGPRQHFLARF
jgi:hypothetical protein